MLYVLNSVNNVTYLRDAVLWFMSETLVSTNSVNWFVTGVSISWQEEEKE